MKVIFSKRYLDGAGWRTDPTLKGLRWALLKDRSKLSRGEVADPL
jgi:hypothetical protein